MAYIKIMKAGTEYDLLPADTVTNVESTGQTNCVIEYGLSVVAQPSATAPEIVKATLVITAADGGIGSATEVRLRINNAISQATANSAGPPVLVDLTSATGGTETLTSTSWGADIF